MIGLIFLNSAIFFKIDDHVWKLKSHVTGALANFRTKAAAYIDCCQWPHDSNLTINILLKILLMFQTMVRMSFPRILQFSYFK